MDLWISFRFVKDADAVSNDEEVSDSESEGEIEMESGDEVGDMDVGVGDDASLDLECEGLPRRRVKQPNGVEISTHNRQGVYHI